MGHQQYITHHDNVPIIHHRLGKIVVTGKAYGESFTINGVRFSFHPAGRLVHRKFESNTEAKYGYLLGLQA